MSGFVWLYAELAKIFMYKWMRTAKIGQKDFRSFSVSSLFVNLVIISWHQFVNLHYFPYYLRKTTKKLNFIRAFIIYKKMSKRYQRAKISSVTCITDLPEFEKSEGLLNVQKTIQKIEEKSPGRPKPRSNRTKDIGAQILGSDYGKLRNKVGLKVHFLSSVIYFLSLITGSSYSRFSPLARPRSTPSTPQRIITSPSHWVKVNSCTNEEISVKSPVFWPQSTKSEPASPSRLCSTPVRRSPKETLQLLRSFYFFSCNFMSLFNRQLYGGARRVRLICDDHDSLPLLPIVIS